MIDKNNIFNLFPDPNDTPDDSIDADIEIDILDSAHYKVGMFTKLILNQKNFVRTIENFYDRAGKKFDKESHEVHSRFVVYNRAWHYVKNVNLDNREHLADIVVSDIYDFAYALHLAIKYFESTEEYENCAHMHKIQQFLEEFESTDIDDSTMTLLQNIKDNLES